MKKPPKQEKIAFALEVLEDGLASNKLFHGEVSDFYEAMYLMRAEFAYEVEHAFSGNDEDDIDFRKQVKEVNQAIDKAWDIYQQCMEKARQKAAELMRVEDDAHLNWIADAVESGDYSQLAI